MRTLRGLMLKIAGLLVTGSLVAVASVELLQPPTAAGIAASLGHTDEAETVQRSPWRFDAFRAEFHSLNRQLALLQRHDEPEDPLQEYRQKSAAIRLLREAQATLPIALTLRTPRGIWDLDLPLKVASRQDASAPAASAASSGAEQAADDVAALSSQVMSRWGWTLTGKARVQDSPMARISIADGSSQRLPWLLLLIASAVGFGLLLATLVRTGRPAARVEFPDAAAAPPGTAEHPTAASAPERPAYREVLQQHHDLRAQLNRASEELALITHVMQERREARQPSKS